MVALMFGGFFESKKDHLIFSKGHAAPLLYSLYAALGKVREKELLTLRKFGSRLEGHPMMTFPFTEAPTGSLGQGLSIGIGMALAGQRSFVLLGDGEMAEGQVWEAINFAGHRKLRNIVAIVDINRLGQSAPTADEWNIRLYQRRFKAFGWKTFVTDGHNLGKIQRGYAKTLKHDGPFAILAKTVKGKGVSFLEDKPGWHGKALTERQLKKALEELQ